MVNFQNKTTNIIERGFIFVSIISLTFFMYVIYKHNENVQEHTDVIENARIEEVQNQTKTEIIGLPFRVISKLKNLHIIAKSYVIYDVKSNTVLYGKDETVPRPIASITKTMTALTACDYKNDVPRMQIAEYDINTDGYSALHKGEVWNTTELLRYMMTVSSNDGATAVARNIGLTIDQSNPVQAFVDLMNKKATLYGLTSATFRNPHGLDESATLSGADASALDIAKLLTHTSECPEAFDTTVETNARVEDNARTIHITNTNMYASTIPGLLVSKTGYTDLAGGNLAVKIDRGLGEEIVIVVLGSTRDERFTDVIHLYETLTGL